MKTNSDFKDLLHDLNVAGVRYPIIGGYAVLCRQDALRSKMAAGRARDRRDAAKLARGNRERRPGRRK